METYDEWVARHAREDRDARLLQCDYVVVRAQELGEPLDPAWATYRQALRDVPSQAGFPNDIVWPSKQ